MIILKRLIFIFLLALSSFLLSPAALADILPPDGGREIKSADYCFQINNIGQFSNYFFLVDFESENPGLNQKGDISSQIIRSDGCISISGAYRPLAVVYALAKNKVNRQGISITNSSDSIKISPAGRPQLIPSNLKIYPVTSWPSRFKIREVRDVLSIVNVERSLELKFQKIIYNYENGASEEQSYRVQGERPEPAGINQTSKSSQRLYTLLPILGIPIFGTIFVLKKAKLFTKRERR